MCILEPLLKFGSQTLVAKYVLCPVDSSVHDHMLVEELEPCVVLVVELWKELESYVVLVVESESALNSHGPATADVPFAHSFENEVSHVDTVVDATNVWHAESE